jgi:hypothetical protein
MFYFWLHEVGCRWLNIPCFSWWWFVSIACMHTGRFFDSAERAFNNWLTVLFHISHAIIHYNFCVILISLHEFSKINKPVQHKSSHCQPKLYKWNWNKWNTFKHDVFKFCYFFVFWTCLSKQTRKLFPDKALIRWNFIPFFWLHCKIIKN